MNKNEIILISLSQCVYYENVHNCEKLQKSKICYYTSLYIYLSSIKITYLHNNTIPYTIYNMTWRWSRACHSLPIYYVADIGIELMYRFIMILNNMLIHVRNACIGTTYIIWQLLDLIEYPRGAYSSIKSVTQQYTIVTRRILWNERLRPRISLKVKKKITIKALRRL